jgi:hypothetical protein
MSGSFPAQRTPSPLPSRRPPELNAARGHDATMSEESDPLDSFCDDVATEHFDEHFDESFDKNESTAFLDEDSTRFSAYTSAPFSKKSPFGLALIAVVLLAALAGFLWSQAQPPPPARKVVLTQPLVPTPPVQPLASPAPTSPTSPSPPPLIVVEPLQVPSHTTDNSNTSPQSTAGRTTEVGAAQAHDERNDERNKEVRVTTSRQRLTQRRSTQRRSTQRTASKRKQRTARRVRATQSSRPSKKSAPKTESKKQHYIEFTDAKFNALMIHVNNDKAQGDLARAKGRVKGYLKRIDPKSEHYHNLTMLLDSLR